MLQEWGSRMTLYKVKLEVSDLIGGHYEGVQEIKAKNAVEAVMMAADKAKVVDE
jgi:hypothetical protein